MHRYIKHLRMHKIKMVLQEWPTVSNTYLQWALELRERLKCSIKPFLTSDTHQKAGRLDIPL